MFQRKESFLCLCGKTSSVYAQRFVFISLCVSLSIIRRRMHLLACWRKMQHLQTIALWTMPGEEQRHITSSCSLRGSCTMATWRMPCAQVPNHSLVLIILLTLYNHTLYSNIYTLIYLFCFSL